MPTNLEKHHAYASNKLGIQALPSSAQIPPL